MSEPSRSQCKHFVIRKKRLCKMTVKEGEDYCGEHQKLGEVKSMNETNELTKTRIVCPLDKKHTCYAHNLKKHLKICNARETTVEPYICKGINSGNGDIFSRELEESTDCHKLLSTFSDLELKNTISKVNELYERLIAGRISEKISTHELLEEEMTKLEYGDKTKKHLKQASSILGLLYDCNLVKPNTCFIEFGAGRGQLSYWIAKSTESDEGSSILLIERASPKHKRDNKLPKLVDKVQRIRADISDLVLDRLDIITKSKHIVGVTKHLCGEATGVDGYHIQERSFSRILKANGLTKADFEIMTGIASWAICGTGLSRERMKLENDTADCLDQSSRDNRIGLNRQEKEKVGRRSKNLLNWGRLCYLEKLNFKCNLHYYIDRNITLENVCIIAHK